MSATELFVGIVIVSYIVKRWIKSSARASTAGDSTYSSDSAWGSGNDSERGGGGENSGSCHYSSGASGSSESGSSDSGSSDCGGDSGSSSD